MKGKVLLSASVLILLTATGDMLAQRRWYRGNVRGIIRQLESDTDRFKSSLDSALDRSTINGTRAEDEINEYVKQFEQATDRLRDRSDDRDFAPAAARAVLTRGRSINGFMRANRLGGRAESDWARVRNDLNKLSNSYYIGWRW
ncbi:MAG TPA: hypothetical protein VI031_06425 [Pyrinomonadaceae bacterium]